MVREPVVQLAKQGPPRPPRQIRMIVGHLKFNNVAELWYLPVPNLKWGTLMDMAPAVSRQISVRLLLE